MNDTAHPDSSPQPDSVRNAVDTDRSAALDVARGSGLFSPNDLAEVEALFDAYIANKAGNDRWLVYDPGTGPLGIAYVALERMTEGTWNLLLLAVHHDHQSAGIGTALIGQVEADLRTAGASVLLVETSGVPEFVRQRRFYTGLGYAEEARIRDFYAPGDDMVVFWKRLSASS